MIISPKLVVVNLPHIGVKRGADYGAGYMSPYHIHYFPTKSVRFNEDLSTNTLT